MKKTVIIPDIHHNTIAVEEILLKELPDKVVFLGDWFDDFHDDEELSQHTATWLIRRMRLHPEDVFIWGNHDVHYAFPSRHTRCSGYTTAKCEAIRDLVTQKHWDRFEFVHWEEDWLCTHAGVTTSHIPASFRAAPKEWLEGQSVQAQMKLRQERPHWFFEAGTARGGRTPFGGLLWCDTSEFLPTPGLNQLFGHTPRRDVWKYDTNRRTGVVHGSQNYCLDTYLRYYGVFTDGKFSIGERELVLP